MNYLTNTLGQYVRLGAMGIVFTVLMSCFASLALARGDCASFSVTIGSATFTPGPRGDSRTTLSAEQASGQIAQVRGTFVAFDVDLDTFTVTDYTLTGVPAPAQITDQPTTIFTGKVPEATLTGSLNLRVRTSGQHLVMERSGPGMRMKIQAKDCDQGGLFQMEPEPATTETNTLAPEFAYCFQASPSARKFFTNGIVLGFDSPQAATLLSGDETTAVWSVGAGGRIGLVLGEDAVQALALAGPEAIAACPHQTP